MITNNESKVKSLLNMKIIRWGEHKGLRSNCRERVRIGIAGWIGLSMFNKEFRTWLQCMLCPRLLNSGPGICQKSGCESGCKIRGSEFRLSKYSYQRARRATREKRETWEDRGDLERRYERRWININLQTEELLRRYIGLYTASG